MGIGMLLGVEGPVSVVVVEADAPGVPSIRAGSTGGSAGISAVSIAAAGGGGEARVFTLGLADTVFRPKRQREGEAWGSTSLCDMELDIGGLVVLRRGITSSPGSGVSSGEATTLVVKTLSGVGAWTSMVVSFAGFGDSAV
jgi:hypothetical protein